MSRTPSRRRDGRDQAWERWLAAINTPDGVRRPTRRPRRRLTRALVGIGVISVVAAALRAARHRRGEPRSSRRIEFVDVDRPVARR
jgi:hypothetical protein